jgi:hypothetical protein
MGSGAGRVPRVFCPSKMKEEDAENKRERAQPVTSFAKRLTKSIILV